MATITTASVQCPAAVSCCAGKCGGEAVTATYRADSVEVSACSYLLAQGWTGANVVLWHNQALQYLVPATTAVQHVKGLVVFA